MFERDPGLHIGTSSWSSKDWVGPFYPPKTPPERFIEHYATVYDTVEIDATFYRMPTAKNVDAWRRRTPEGFTFAVKTPRIITHDKMLVNVDDDMTHFLDVITGLGNRLGPILLQFPYFNQRVFPDRRVFFDQLGDFLSTLPQGLRIAVEVRNKAWVGPELLEVCQSNGAALAWVYQAWMPPARVWLELIDYVRADFAYIRWLGDHKAIEQITTRWDKLVIDRSSVIADWVDAAKTLRQRQIETFGYFNNHFAGHAPASAEIFRQMWAGR